MSRLQLIAAHTYRRQVLRKGFLASLLSVPVIVALSFGLIYFAVQMQEDRRPVGYVDNAGVLAQPTPVPQGAGDSALAMIPFATADAARKALLAGEIQSYYVVAADYRMTRRVEVVYNKKAPGGAEAAQFHDYMRTHLLASEPAEIAQRIALGTEVVVRRPEGGREFPDSASLADVAPIFVILFMALGFMILIGLNPGQPMLAVAEEKENRTVEILVTSVSPSTLIAGKVVGTLAIVATLVATWVLLIAGAYLVAVHILRLPALQGLHISPSIVLFSASLYVPVYVIIAALMTAVGATVVEGREAQQLAFIFILPLMIPFYVLEPIIEHPDGLLAVVLSIFPLSAPSILPLRVFIEPVPAWQIGLSVVLSLLSAVAAVWVAGRAFRVSLLRYGQRLRWREILGRTGGQQ